MTTKLKQGDIVYVDYSLIKLQEYFGDRSLTKDTKYIIMATATGKYASIKPKDSFHNPGDIGLKYLRKFQIRRRLNDTIKPTSRD